ncbi:LacI family DNA-binding transcriptional regulator [Herbiconiux sp. P17]|uniref:LacI family DNA-binding transcriptional regulator n=1 Tax=Herbiconiux wuyangfengii TaxID=3342794 RepID=UPI0035B9D3BE
MPHEPQARDPRRATIRDVAARAGVSPGTVSKALNGTGSVSAATRERILAVAQEFDFRPNELARSVFERRSFTVGVITSDSSARFTVPLIFGAEDALGAGRISVFMCDSRDDPIREQHYIEVLLGRRVDGLILVGGSSDPREPLRTDPGVPVVYAYTPSSDENDCSIMVDDRAVGRTAVEHLVLLGRRRIAHITGPQSFAATPERAEGYADALAAAALDPVGPVYYGSWSEEWGRTALEALLRAHPDVDAVYCGSDVIARGVEDALRDHGRTVPGDVAVVGTDNWEVVATGARPPLTTVDFGLARIGRVAAQRLLDAIAGDRHHGIERMPGELVLRESTA